ncbi:MAG: hypothetical protein J0H49_13900 [Acidobacteria bacterium]|nr:hypothetical protein [Acidobacteriota bacterium]
MGRCACGVDLGFLKNGECDRCREELAECEKGIALLRRLNPPKWTRPGPYVEVYEGYYSFSVTTSDRDRADGFIEITDRMWRLTISVNDVLLFERRGAVWDRFYVDQLRPYVLSIPADPDEIRKADEARRAYELKVQAELELKRKYGL